LTEPGRCWSIAGRQLWIENEGNKYVRFMARGDKSFTLGNKYVRIMTKGDKSFTSGKKCVKIMAKGDKSFT
jgi:hypothetical protein